MSYEQVVAGLNGDLTKVASLSPELAEAMRIKLAQLDAGLSGIVRNTEAVALRKNQALEDAHVEVASQRSLNDKATAEVKAMASELKASEQDGIDAQTAIHKASQIDVSSGEARDKLENYFYHNNDQATPALTRKQANLYHKISKARMKAYEAFEELPELVIEKMAVDKILEARGKKSAEKQRQKFKMAMLKKQEQALKAQRQKLALEQKMNALAFQGAGGGAQESISLVADEERSGDDADYAPDAHGYDDGYVCFRIFVSFLRNAPYVRIFVSFLRTEC